MWKLRKKILFFLSGSGLILFLGSLLANVQRITPAPRFNHLDSSSLLDAIFAIGLACVVLFLSVGLGQLIIKPFKIKDRTFIECTVIYLPLGLAVIGYGEFFLGLVGWIKPIHQIAWLTIVSIVSLKSSVSFLEEGFGNFKKLFNIWKEFSYIKKILLSAGVLAIFLALFQTLSPPWDYDGLMYHL